MTVLRWRLNSRTRLSCAPCPRGTGAETVHVPVDGLLWRERGDRSRFSLPLLVSSQYPLARGVWSRVESTTQAPNFCQGSKGINLSSRVRVLGGHYPAFNTSQEKGLQWWYSGYEVIEGPSHPWTYSSTLSVWLSSMLIAEKKAIIQNGPGNSLKSKHVPDRSL